MKLSQRETRRAAVIGAALLPADTFDGLRRNLDLGAALAGEFRTAPWWTAAFVRLALLVVWYAPLWLRSQGRRGPRTFGALSPPSQEALLEVLLDHPRYFVRESTAILKLFLCMAFLGDVAVLRRLGAYDLGAPIALRPRAPEARP